MMNILCPTDFSEHSLYALHYAIDKANKLDAKIHLLTAYSVPRSTGALRSIDKVIQDSVLEELRNLVKNIGPKITTGFEPAIHIMEGNSGRVICQFADEHDMDLIIMGTQGKGNISNILLGSVAKKVVEQSRIPVIAIPSQINKDSNPSKVLLALDEKEIIHKENIAFLKDYAKKDAVVVDVYHMNQIPGKSDLNARVLESINEITGQVYEEFGTEPIQGIAAFTGRHKTGMLIMVRRPHSFWSRLFSDSNTVAELASTKTPLMVLPD
jgi:nucleotide-binding universal stress UspA family protein